MWVGTTRWAEATATLHRQLEAAQEKPTTPRHFSARDLDGLPAPVQRYLRAALTDGQRRVRSMDMAQTGTMDFGERTPRWLPFHATERATTDRPGFVWDAAVRMLPGVVVRGRLVDGRSVPTVWEGRWTDYGVRDGMRVPLAGEVAWRRPEGLKPYWRGRVTRLDYTFED